MEYKIGNSNKIDSIGESVEITCPKCNQKTNFSVFSNLDTRFIPKFPLIYSKNVIFLFAQNAPQYSELTTKTEIYSEKAKSLQSVILI